jgi:hypothetical protein
LLSSHIVRCIEEILGVTFVGGKLHSFQPGARAEDIQDNGASFALHCYLKSVCVDMTELQGVAEENLNLTTTSILTNSFYTAFRDRDLVEEPDKDHVCRCASFIESKDSG